jgi:hypothetical protein
MEKTTISLRVAALGRLLFLTRRQRENFFFTSLRNKSNLFPAAQYSYAGPDGFGMEEGGSLVGKESAIVLSRFFSRFASVSS